MLPCYKCQHRGSIPGDAHTQCKADWKGKKLPACKSAYGQQWYHFPFNFDPTWGPDQCEQFKAKEEK